MEKKKVLSVFGTRPEAIKMAPVVKELESREGIESVVCVTAQHRDMLDQVLEIFKIKPDYDLNIMKPGQTLTHITAEVLKGIEEVIIKEKPDLVLVHGDTTTAMAAALAAFYQQVKVGHVEAGLRTYDKYSPFPEEMNRQIIDKIADYLFAPTEISKANIGDKLNKGQEVFVTGNTAIDALKTTVSEDYSNPNLEWAEGSRLILVTAHRRENLGEPMRHIFKAIRRIVDEYPDVKVIYPVHLNPNVHEPVKRILGQYCGKNIHLIPPQSYLQFVALMERSYLILTDSGGVQEEAPSLGKPVLVMRDTTERPEAVEAGTVKIVGASSLTIEHEVGMLLTDVERYKQMATSVNPYGDGKATERIIDVLSEKGEHC